MTADLDLVGLDEVADRLGVARQTARQWRVRDTSGLPEAEWTISGAPAWRWATIRDWAEDTGRL